MRDKLYSLFIDLKYKCSYLEEYWSHAKRMDSLITFSCSLVSLSSIASWAIWRNFPALWAVLIALTQVVQAAKPYLPYAGRLAAIKFADPDLKQMLIDIEFEWDGLELKSADEDAYRETHHKFSERYRSIYSRYFGTDNIPMQQRIYSNAEKRCKVHFSKYYNTQEWRETDVGKENASINA